MYRFIYLFSYDKDRRLFTVDYCLKPNEKVQWNYNLKCPNMEMFGNVYVHVHPLLKRVFTNDNNNLADENRLFVPYRTKIDFTQILLALRS